MAANSRKVRRSPSSLKDILKNPKQKEEFTQIYEKQPWIQKSGIPYTQTCCDCGQSHSIELTVLNQEEIKVEYFCNDFATAHARETDDFHYVHESLLFTAIQAIVNKDKSELKRIRDVFKPIKGILGNVNSKEAS